MTSGQDPRADSVLLDAVFEHAPVALCVAGPDGVVLRANERWLRAARRAAGEVLGRDVLAPFPREWRVRGLLARARGGEAVALPPLRRGGAEWQATATPVPAPGGAELLLMLQESAGTAGALRARATSASPRGARRQAPAADEPVLRALVNAMPQVVCVLQPDGTPEYVNPAWTAFSGLGLDASVERGWLGVVHPDDVPALRACWRRARESGTPEQVELRYRAADGSYRWFLSRLAPIEERGRLVRWVGAGIEIEERRRAEAERERLLARLEAADRRKTEFLAVLSHELRNPLAPLRTAAYVLERVPGGGTQARAAVGAVSRQVELLARLVDDLLDVTRITRGKVQLRRTRVDLAELARRTAEDHRALFSGRGLALDVAAPRPVWVKADATRMAQVVGNLLANAAKFTDAGGRVTLFVAEEGGRAVIRVADTGIGMPPELLARAFEPFVQAEDAPDARRGGLGLGLALVKGFVELHGGTVEARSEGPGRGAELTIALPLHVARELETPVPPTGAPFSARRVLVVEDNRDAADMLRVALELDGHEVEVAHDAAHALERTRTFLPDVVLCDIGLPDRDGYALARDIRAVPELAGVRLIALTGYAQPEDQRRAVEAGFDAHLGKPVSPKELERVLHRYGP